MLNYQVNYALYVTVFWEIVQFNFVERCLYIGGTYCLYEVHFFHHEDGGRKFLLNVGVQLPKPDGVK
jgi:hypothetical protein